jgi:hypothetical protein
VERPLGDEVDTEQAQGDSGDLSRAFAPPLADPGAEGQAELGF